MKTNDRSSARDINTAFHSRGFNHERCAETARHTAWHYGTNRVKHELNYYTNVNNLYWICSASFVKDAYDTVYHEPGIASKLLCSRGPVYKDHLLLFRLITAEHLGTRGVICGDNSEVQRLLPLPYLSCSQSVVLYPLD